jgi:hypothetical protein
MIDRRTVLLGGALHVLYVSCAHSQDIYNGCLITDRQSRSKLRSSTSFGYSGGQTVGSSGDRDLDRALAQTLAFLSDSFSVLPGFAFLDDAKGPNAYASTSKALGRTDGSVLFGLRLLRNTLRQPEHPDVHIAAICAHEFGHICQYKHNVIARLKAGSTTVKRVELHADYLAGAFAGLRKLRRGSFPAAVVALAQYNVGDHQTSNPQHHGTPAERGQAVVEGFKAIYERREPFGTAFRKGIDYALSVR